MHLDVNNATRFAAPQLLYSREGNKSFNIRLAPSKNNTATKDEKFYRQCWGIFGKSSLFYCEIRRRSVPLSAIHSGLFRKLFGLKPFALKERNVDRAPAFYRRARLKAPPSAIKRGCRGTSRYCARFYCTDAAVGLYIKLCINEIAKERERMIFLMDILSSPKKICYFPKRKTISHSNLNVTI